MHSHESAVSSRGRRATQRVANQPHQRDLGGNAGMSSGRLNEGWEKDMSISESDGENGNESRNASSYGHLDRSGSKFDRRPRSNRGNRTNSRGVNSAYAYRDMSRYNVRDNYYNTSTLEDRPMLSPLEPAGGGMEEERMIDEQLDAELNNLLDDILEDDDDGTSDRVKEECPDEQGRRSPGINCSRGFSDSKGCERKESATDQGHEHWANGSFEDEEKLPEWYSKKLKVKVSSAKSRLYQLSNVVCYACKITGEKIKRIEKDHGTSFCRLDHPKHPPLCRSWTNSWRFKCVVACKNVPKPPEHFCTSSCEIFALEHENTGITLRSNNILACEYPKYVMDAVELFQEFLNNNQDRGKNVDVKKLSNVKFRSNHKKELLLVPCGKGVVSMQRSLQRFFERNRHRLSSVIIVHCLNKTNQYFFKDKDGFLPTLRDKIGPIMIKYSPRTIVEFNAPEIYQLNKILVEYLEPEPDTVAIELGSYSNILSLMLADKCHTVIGLNTLEYDIKLAEETKRLNKILNTSFITCKPKEIETKIAPFLMKRRSIAIINLATNFGKNRDVVRDLRKLPTIWRVVAYGSFDVKQYMSFITDLICEDDEKGEPFLPVRGCILDKAPTIKEAYTIVILFERKSLIEAPQSIKMDHDVKSEFDCLGGSRGSDYSEEKYSLKMEDKYGKNIKRERNYNYENIRYQPSTRNCNEFDSPFLKLNEKESPAEFDRSSRKAREYSTPERGSSSSTSVGFVKLKYERCSTPPVRQEFKPNKMEMTCDDDNRTSPVQRRSPLPPVVEPIYRQCSRPSPPASPVPSASFSDLRVKQEKSTARERPTEAFHSKAENSLKTEYADPVKITQETGTKDSSTIDLDASLSIKKEKSTEQESEHQNSTPARVKREKADASESTRSRVDKATVTCSVEARRSPARTQLASFNVKTELAEKKNDYNDDDVILLGEKKRENRVLACETISEGSDSEDAFVKPEPVTLSKRFVKAEPDETDIIANMETPLHCPRATDSATSTFPQSTLTSVKLSDDFEFTLDVSHSYMDMLLNRDIHQRRLKVDSPEKEESKSETTVSLDERPRLNTSFCLKVKPTSDLIDPLPNDSSSNRSSLLSDLNATGSWHRVKIEPPEVEQADRQPIQSESDVLHLPMNAGKTENQCEIKIEQSNVSITDSNMQENKSRVKVEQPEENNASSNSQESRSRVNVESLENKVRMKREKDVSRDEDEISRLVKKRKILEWQIQQQEEIERHKRKYGRSPSPELPRRYRQNSTSPSRYKKYRSSQRRRWKSPSPTRRKPRRSLSPFEIRSRRPMIPSPDRRTGKYSKFRRSPMSPSPPPRYPRDSVKFPRSPSSPTPPPRHNRDLFKLQRSPSSPTPPPRQKRDLSRIQRSPSSPTPPPRHKRDLSRIQRSPLSPTPPPRYPHDSSKFRRRSPYSSDRKANCLRRSPSWSPTPESSRRLRSPTTCKRTYD